MVDVSAVRFPMKQYLCSVCNSSCFFRYEFVDGVYNSFEMWVCSKCGNFDVIMPSQEVGE